MTLRTARAGRAGSLDSGRRLELVATAEAARDALALAIAVCEADRLAADTLMTAYPDRPRALLDGFVHVVRTLALQRITDCGGDYSEAAIAA